MILDSSISAEERQSHRRHGLVIVNTGPGKGKTTAALGTLLRAWGHDMDLCVIQFIKDEKGRWGETIAAERLGIEWHTLGRGYTWGSDDPEADRQMALAGWELAKDKIASGRYDLVVLDEFTYPMAYDWLPARDVIDWLRAHRPSDLHLIITGRKADPALVDYADLVTEMVAVKHPYDRKTDRIAAQAGIEF